MKRRDILRYTALVTGSAISAPLLSTLLTGCSGGEVKNSEKLDLKFFTDEEFRLVKDLIDVILPKTDSPSASEVGVHQIIDNMVGTVYQTADKERYKTGFSALAAHLNKASEGNYIDLTSDEKIGLLKALEGLDNKTLRDAYLNLKQQTVAYYLSTEEVGKNFLNYLPVPGKYQACISLSEVGGKAWAI